jgi:hypothetical protein
MWQKEFLKFSSVNAFMRFCVCVASRVEVNTLSGGGGGGGHNILNIIAICTH